MSIFDHMPFKQRATPAPLDSTLGGQPVPLIQPLHSFLDATSYGGTIVRPTESTVFGLPAANRCLNLISNAVGQMLTHGNVEGATQLPLICDRPNLYYGSYEFWQEAVATAIVHGNYVALIADVDVDGYPQQMTPIHPALVNLKVEQGQPVYEIGDNRYNWRQVVHVRGLTLPGSRWGIGVLEAHRRGLMAAYDQQTFAIKSIENGGSPNLVISLDTPNQPVQDELDRIKNQWTTTYTRGNREVAVVPKTMNIEPVQWSPEDMEFLESRRFTIAEMAFIFNLDPTDLSASIGAQGTLNYQNGSSREVVRLLHSYGPWLHRFEEAWSDLLPPGQTFVGNVSAILRMDPEQQSAMLIAQVAAGLLTADEARELLGRPPLPVSAGTTQSEELPA